MKVDYSIIENFNLISEDVEREDREFPGAFKGVIMAVIFAMPWWLIFFGIFKMIF